MKSQLRRSENGAELPVSLTQKPSFPRMVETVLREWLKACGVLSITLVSHIGSPEIPRTDSLQRGLAVSSKFDLKSHLHPKSNAPLQHKEPPSLLFLCANFCGQVQSAQKGR